MQNGVDVLIVLSAVADDLALLQLLPTIGHHLEPVVRAAGQGATRPRRGRHAAGDEAVGARWPTSSSRTPSSVVAWVTAVQVTLIVFEVRRRVAAGRGARRARPAAPARAPRPSCPRPGGRPSWWPPTPCPTAPASSARRAHDENDEESCQAACSARLLVVLWRVLSGAGEGRSAGPAVGGRARGRGRRPTGGGHAGEGGQGEVGVGTRRGCGRRHAGIVRQRHRERVVGLPARPDGQRAWSACGRCRSSPWRSSTSRRSGVVAMQPVCGGRERARRVPGGVGRVGRQLHRGDGDRVRVRVRDRDDDVAVAARVEEVGRRRVTPRR